MREILTKTCFSPQNESYTAKLCFLLFLIIFGEIHRELLFLVIKGAISERNIEILRNFFFNKFEKGQILRKIWICLNIFLINQ